MKPVCSIVIRAYNEEKHIGRLLTGIMQQTLKDVQIILVDSGSTDATVGIASRFPVEIVHIKPEDFTFGRSLNLGIARAKADVVVMASAHVYPVYPDWLEKLIAPFAEENVGLAYGKQRGADATHFSEHQIFQHWFPDVSKPRQDYPFCNNANSAIRFALWQEHPYDEVLPALEDLAWAKWVQEKGFAISYVPEAEIIHVHEEAWKSVFNRYQREGMAFKQIYPDAEFGPKDRWQYFVQNVRSDWKAARAQGCWKEVWREVMRFRWQQFNGTYQGYKTGTLTWKLRETFYYPHNELPEEKKSSRMVDPIHYEDLTNPTSETRN